ncbi:hypothetical protein BDD43_3229 [Mucilaginibacter gracilis]|uniref:Uncharacterized protein n=1 Tax=Mucilaginibacter gracilis TaxID=423350 RepID=A0A495J4W4_9SPHI|nr:hypothetical protein [Mucilaginibacter gracilis]RKR83029.1 hypothetical protein BDD43_3229 [Mucilaginibacter gracilis]
MVLTEDNKKTYKAIILLNELINGTHKFQTVSNGDDSVLEPLFIELMAKGYVTTAGVNYAPTDKGEDVFASFMQRYTEYLKVYDVFSFVDLEKGEFAFARYFDFDTDEQWDDFVNDERFDDLRIAVAIFKKIDPNEIVFMSFINENRFDTQSAGWQMDLVSDNTWAEIAAIVDTAIKPGEVGLDAMEDMIRQGTDLMMDLLKEEERQRQEDIQNNTYDGGDTVVYETVEYYEPYYDPWYVSPIWYVPLFLW